MRFPTAMAALGAVVVAGAVFAADPPAKKPAVSGKLSMAVDGRYHQTHVKVAKLACDSCHTRTPEDILFLRKDEAWPAGMPGQVDRNICIGCHLPGTKGSFWAVVK